ncbi:MAG: L-lactate permease, partial [Acetobacteraceae bacterium]
GGFLALTVLWILLPALAIHRLQTERGGIDTLQAVLGAIARGPAERTLLIGWFFALFIEGASGFGTPVALAAPLLVAVGVEPARAVAIALIGHAVGVSFGAVGTPVLAQAELVALPAADLARVTAQLHAGLGLGLVIATLAQARAFAAGATLAFGLGVAAAAGFFVPSVLVATFVGPELPTLLGALVGGAVFVLLLRRGGGAGVTRDGRSALLAAASPYLTVIALVLATRLVGPVRAAAQSVVLRWSLAGLFSGSFQPLFHPGTLLLGGFLLGGLAQGASVRDLAAVIARSSSRLGTVAVALVAMLALSRLMLHAGLVDTLADAAGAALGEAYPLAAPVVGALGTFVTGSATASNILFSSFQEASAGRLGLPALLILSAQGVGAAVGNIVCPHNIVAGAAAVGAAGREGAILRATLAPCLLYLAACGALTFALAPR